ncbi:ATP-binding protein [filamentous cyanobacterium LEGE 11480]|uniref:ATP-binding protein n=2 Tax=Romeriopsis TaxID=2992131 RepID=A0A928VLZ2_9CYAN|nr:ATP-binding protein [Romeriopsis navalis LEGE 11480]
MARSLKVAPPHIAQVNLAVKRRGYPSQKQFAADVGPSLSTVKKFLKGEAIDYENFRELCERLELDWQSVVDLATDETVVNTAAPLTGEIAAFNPSHPISHPMGFFGRSREINRSFGLLKRRPLQNIAIIGPRKSGKTSLLKHLAQLTLIPAVQLRGDQNGDRLLHPEQYKWIFVDLQDPRLGTRDGLIKHLLSALGVNIEHCDLEQFMDLMSTHLQQPTVMLLDEIGSVLKRDSDLDDTFWESLRSLASNHSNGNLSFILTSHEHPTELASHTGHSSPFFNIFGYATNLGPLAETDARALIGSSPIAFDAADIAWIIEQSECWPFLIQILCQYRLEALRNQETDDIWKAEGLQQLEFYRRG